MKKYCLNADKKKRKKQLQTTCSSSVLLSAIYMLQT